MYLEVLVVQRLPHGGKPRYQYQSPVEYLSSGAAQDNSTRESRLREAHTHTNLVEGTWARHNARHVAVLVLLYRRSKCYYGSNLRYSTP